MYIIISDLGKGHPKYLPVLNGLGTVIWLSEQLDKLI